MTSPTTTDPLAGPAPKPGQMVLYDAVLPPLPSGDWTLTATVAVAGPGTGPLRPEAAQLRIEGPRFTLAPQEISAVHPPKDASGSFHEVLPHVVLGRRTLPWERALDPAGRIPAPPARDDDPEPRDVTTPAPWLALLVFLDDPAEARVLRGVRLGDVLPASVLPDLAGADAGTLDPGATVDAIEAPGPLLRRLLPSPADATLLTHVRRVNVDDRELAAGDSDGWFAVVTANRLPAAGTRHRACLVSLEGRSDLVPAGAWRAGDPLPAAPATARLVLLHTWTFTCAPAVRGGGSFRELAVALDVGLAGHGAAGLTADGLVPLDLQGRDGRSRTVRYRGPLAPEPVPRDPLGPYHGADQARRVDPADGVEDVSYATAFEVGRLLAAADARFGADLLRWRGEAYRQSARADVGASVWSTLPSIPTDLPRALRRGMVTPVAVTVLADAGGSGSGAPADVTGLAAAASAPGLDAATLATTWGVTPAAAQRLLRGGDVPEEPAAGPAPAVLPDPAPDPAQELVDARNRLLRAPGRRP